MSGCKNHERNKMCAFTFEENILSLNGEKTNSISMSNKKFFEKKWKRILIEVAPIMHFYVQEFFPETFQKMKHLKDHPEMHCRNFKVPVMKDDQIIEGSQNSIFASCAFVNSHTDIHKDSRNCQDGITGIFCTEKTKENETDVARPLPFTVLLEYKLLNDENDMKGVGLEVRGVTSVLAMLVKNGMEAKKLTIHKEDYWSGNNIVTFKCENIKVNNFKVSKLLGRQ